MTGPKPGIIAVSGGLVAENVLRSLFGAILLPDELTTQSFSSHRDQGGEVMASLATQRIAAADSSHGSSVEHLPSVAERTSFDGVTHIPLGHRRAGARIIHDRNLVPAVT